MAQTKPRTATKAVPKAARTARPTAAASKQNIRARRSLGRRLLLHPTSVFALLLLGVFLAGLTYRVAASDYTVNATVTAQPLQIGASINDPQDNQTVTSRPIMVTGDCPNDAYVKLMRNGAFSGVAICNNGSFQIQTDLYVGMNELQAQDYNITDQAGPVTPIVHVTYKVPTAAASADADNTTAIGQTGDTTAVPDGSDTALPLLLSSDYHFNVFTTAQQFEWTMQYHTGTAPYDTKIDWGDNQKSHMVVATAAAFKISHRYVDGGYYPIIVSGTDAKHQTISVQLAAYIKKPGDPATNGNILPTSSGSQAASGTSAGGGSSNASNLRWLLYTWPAYAIVIVMIASFWLGERREFLAMAKSPHNYRRRHL